MAEWPHRIPLRGWVDILWRTLVETQKDRLPTAAAGVAYFGLIALAPALGAFVSLYGLFADVPSIARQLKQLAAFVPHEVLDIIGRQMIRLAETRSQTLSLTFVVSLATSLWSVNVAMGVLFDALNLAYEETEKRSFVTRRALTYAYSVAALTFVTVVTALLAAVPFVLRELGLGDSLLIPLRWVALYLVAALAFAVLYRYAPCRARARWRWVPLGAIFAALLWVGGSGAFSWYAAIMIRYDAAWGSLGAAVGLLAWLWFSTLTALIGAELNAEIEHQTAVDSTTGPPQPMGRRGAVVADTVGALLQGIPGAAILRRWLARARRILSSRHL